MESPLVRGGIRIVNGLAEEFAQFIVATDSPLADEGLLNGVLLLEVIGLVARCQVMILDRIALALEQTHRFQAIRADVFGHHHAVKAGDLVFAHGRAPPGLRLAQRGLIGFDHLASRWRAPLEWNETH